MSTKSTSKAESIKRVTVLGAGTMGHGIAQIVSLANCEVTIRDIKQEFLDSGLGKIRWSLGKLAEKGKISQGEASEALSRIRTTIELPSALEGADLVIEAVPEDLNLKKETFKLLDEYAPSNTILASNTSAIPIDEIAVATKRPESVIGLHFFNPPQLMPLVEITPCTRTGEDVVKVVRDFAQDRLKKETVLCRKYVPGFIVNNILGALTRAAIFILEKGDATAVEIDSALRYKAGFPMGVFEVADYSGLDILYNIEKFYKDLGYRSYVSPKVRKLVEEGSLGAKTHKGFYVWKSGQRPNIPESAGEKFDITPIIAFGTNAACELLRENVSDKEDIDKALKLGLGYRKGILAIADEIGLDRLLESLKELNSRLSTENRFEPSTLLVEYVRKGNLGRNSGSGFYNYSQELN